MSLQSILILVIIGLAAGMLGGLVGIGGGLVIVPALVFFLGFSQKTAQELLLECYSFPWGYLAYCNTINKDMLISDLWALSLLVFLQAAILEARLP